MSDAPASEDGKFQLSIYRDLDDKLLASEWNAGASEAHGLLSGLACRGIDDSAIRNKMFLFQATEETTILMLEGMFNLALRDLSSDSFEFTLMIPPEQSQMVEQAESLSSWCQGFTQGFCHDGDAILQNCSTTVSEIMEDIIAISNIIIDPLELNTDEAERDLMEILEYLKISIQLIFDELNSRQTPSAIH